MREQDDTPDPLIARIAAKRHGILRTDHLQAAGLDKSAISRRVAAGHLHALLRGVYAAGHNAVSLKGRWMAAVDACGRGAVLSHLAAACLWGFLTWNESWPVDVTVPFSSGHRNNKPGIRLHRSRTLSGRHTTERSLIPVTNVPRILSDLPHVASPADFRQACRQAEIKGHRTGHPEGHIPNRSELELMMHTLCEKHGLPVPRTRVKIGTYEADFLFGERIIIETDGWETHRTRQAFEDDREREIELALLRYEVHRITRRQIMNRPDWAASSLRTILNRTD